jgi:hypothetical protein
MRRLAMGRRRLFMADGRLNHVGKQPSLGCPRSCSPGSI